jgi:hypothetical protein
MNAIVLKYWSQLETDSIENKMILCSNYPALNSEIPDDNLILESVFEKDDLDEIFSNFEPYIDDRNICPIIEVLGGNVICIGFAPSNEGRVYYFDMEFGLFELDKTLQDFEAKLINSDWNLE